MPTSDGPSHFPVFVAPQHANHQRPPGYVPGRVAPVRLPPPAKALPPPPVKPHGRPPVHRDTFSLSEEPRGKERARSLQQRRNTYICVGVSAAAFLVTLILVLSLRSGNVFDGECKLFSSCNYCFFFFCNRCVIILPLLGPVCRELPRPQPIPP